MSPVKFCSSYMFCIFLLRLNYPCYIGKLDIDVDRYKCWYTHTNIHTHKHFYFAIDFLTRCPLNFKKSSWFSYVNTPPTKNDNYNSPLHVFITLVLTSMAYWSLNFELLLYFSVNSVPVTARYGKIR